ncbi:MAG TPA: hypothetical protein VMW56_24600 [Candidatus Margulisiibacteriota bacterium]|nr:hypothetical protein [Candidatus Margulisiibacteriota bacterium]
MRAWIAICLVCVLSMGRSALADEATMRAQTDEEVANTSRGCQSEQCHSKLELMHAVRKIGCTNCHGGHADVTPGEAAPGTPAYRRAMDTAHVQPRFPERWSDPQHPGRIASADPERTYTLLNQESPEFIRFKNPGDLRVAPQTCGSVGCHPEQVSNVEKSLMTTSAMLWGGAAYNNGIVPLKRYIFGESYSRDGVPRSMRAVLPPNAADSANGVLPFLEPLPRWNVVPPPDPLRAFERGGKVDRSNVSEVGNPNLGPFVDEPGRPDMKFGTRGPGTDLRISAGVLNIHKTRLNDPMLSFLGTNDHPGDFRSSGCSACHVVYANDADPVHSGPYADAGHDGTYRGDDATIPKGESGHPIKHLLTTGIPSSQCMVCHMHQPNAFVNTYYGFQMWDYETDGDLMWPKDQRYPTVDAPAPFNAHDAQRMFTSLVRNPEEAAVRGLWTDESVLRNASHLPTKETKFADYHGHGWIFRAVYWQDRKGNLLDKDGHIIDWNAPDKLDRGVQLMDIHAEKGMHCVDCHFSKDAHGNGKIYGEYPDATEIRCVDCHGALSRRADIDNTMRGGRLMRDLQTPFGRLRFEWVDESGQPCPSGAGACTLIQRSMLYPDREPWVVKQVLDTIDPASKYYNEKARLAKTLQRDGKTWGALPDDPKQLAHRSDEMACYTCHTSWVTSCFGCHLPQQADWKKYMQHFEGGESRNWTSYNPQVLRNDIFMLAKQRHSTTKTDDSQPPGYIIAPARSSSAVMISSTNANRERVYAQQMPVSAEGYSSQAFNGHFPHTVRSKQTRTCTDCHLSEAGDNNAWMAQVLTLGTNLVNFIGRFAWVGEGEDGVEAVGVTEWDEPQAVIGSNLQRLAYPANYQRHVDNGQNLREAYHHSGRNIQSLQLRGEYLYTANGSDGLRVFDVANIDNKGFSERIISAPVSPLGQRAYVKTKDATGVALPTNMPIYYGRPNNPDNMETPMHSIYRYAYVSDRQEGLVVVDVNSLGDGDPLNNFLERVTTFNPDGILTGARYIAVAGNYAYILTPRGLVIVGIGDPLNPTVVAQLGSPDLVEPRAVAIQFRYAFVTDASGLRVIDITSPEAPRLAGALDIAEAGELYVARTYAYVPAGSQGLAIVDVEKPERPFLQQMFNAGGAMNDVRSIRVGATVGSVFAYVADGRNGLRVLQLIAPGDTPGDSGFSPIPTPRLIATYRTHGPALTLSKGIDRDRAVDESGNQVSVFGRLGSRPFTRPEMENLFMRTGRVFTVSDAPPARARKFVRPKEEEAAQAPAPAVQPAAPIQQRIVPGR